MTTPHTAPKAPEAPEAPQQPGTGSFISIPAIIVAALGAATVAVIRPYLETSTENTVFVAMFLSVATTTSTAIYKACVEKSRVAIEAEGGHRFCSPDSWRGWLHASLA